MTGLIAISGANGQYGSALARKLSAAGVPTRLIVRDLSKAPQLANSTVARASYGQYEAYVKALRDVEVFVLVSGEPADNRAEVQIATVKAAHAAGVKHIVYTSIVDSSPELKFIPGQSHYATEQCVSV